MSGTFRPVWLHAPHDRPYTLITRTDERGIRVECATNRLVMALLVAPHLEDGVESAADRAVKEIKRKLVTDFGLEQAVKDELFHKMWLAAGLIRDPSERHVVRAFLSEIGANP